MWERDKIGVAGEVERKGGKGVLNIRRGTGASTHTCGNGCTKCGWDVRSLSAAGEPERKNTQCCTPHPQRVCQEQPHRSLTCVLAPVLSATVVRDRDPELLKQEKKEATRLTTP